VPAFIGGCPACQQQPKCPAKNPWSIAELPANPGFAIEHHLRRIAVAMPVAAPHRSRGRRIEGSSQAATSRSPCRIASRPIQVLWESIQEPGARDSHLRRPPWQITEAAGGRDPQEMFGPSPLGMLAQQVVGIASPPK